LTRNSIVVLGGGAVVRECFLPALEALGVLAGATVADAHPSVTALGEKYPAAQFVCADFRRPLEQLAPGAAGMVIVALPNRFHEEAVNIALERGWHVLCEKPLALGAAACGRLAELAASRRRVLAVNMIRRLYPSVAAARFALERGLIGQVRSLDIQHGSAYAWPAQTLEPFQKENGGVLADMGVHYLDLAESLVGELTPLEYRDDAAGGVEADLEFRLTARHAPQVRIALSRLRSLANRVILTGTCGRVEFSVEDLERCEVVNQDGTRIALELAEPFSAGDFAPTFAACFAQQIHDFSNAVERGTPPAVDGYAAARTAAHIEWAYGQARQSPASRPRREGLRQGPQGAPQGATLRPAPVLITGATGFIGSHLVEILAAEGFKEITALVRSPKTCASIARFPIRLRLADLLNAAQVREAVKGQRHVFHLAFGRDGERTRDTTVEGTRNVVNAAMAEGCESVVITSTMYVFGHPPGVVDESAPYRPVGGEYGVTKAEMERWCLEQAANSGATRIVVLNPTCVYGPRGKTYSELPAGFARQGAFCWVEEGRGTANYTYVTNLVDAMLEAAYRPEAHGERFIISDGVTTWRAFLEPLLEPWLADIRSYSQAELVSLGRPARKGFGEVLAAIAASSEVRSAIRQTGVGGRAVAAVRRYRPSLIPTPVAAPPIIRKAKTADAPGAPAPWLADLFGPTESRFSAEKAARMLGWTPRVDLAQGQRQTIEYLRYMHLR
jgi:nucleoside-diphosphate-sugar epimerase/predicted dehydrogenase